MKLTPAVTGTAASFERSSRGMKTDVTEPIITAVIPTYRRPRLLRRAIKSVLAQTYPHFQVCVYDNASGDETSVAYAWRLRYSYWGLFS